MSVPSKKTLLGVEYTNSQMPPDVLVKVTPNLNGLFYAAAESWFRVVEKAKKEDVEYNLISTYREIGKPGDLKPYLAGTLKPATQWALYEGYIKKLPGFNLAAVPGNSLHGFGISIDIYGKNGTKWKDKDSTYKGAKVDRFQKWLQENGPDFGWFPTGLGFRQTETWHFDYDPDKDPNYDPNTDTRRRVEPINVSPLKITTQIEIESEITKPIYVKNYIPPRELTKQEIRQANRAMFRMRVANTINNIFTKDNPDVQ